MRVLHLSWEFPPRLFGGLGRHVEGLAGALAAAGIDVTVATPHLEPQHGPDAAAGTVRVLRAAAPAAPLPHEQWIAAVLDANVAMAEAVLAGTGLAGSRSAGGSARTAWGAVDLLHVHDWMAGHAGALLAAALDVPVVATIHATERGRHRGHLPPGPSGWIDAQERRLVGLADHVIVCAPGMAAAVRDDLRAGEVTVIRNGVDPARWQRDGPRRPDLVAFCGRLEHEKGLHVLLEASRGLPVEVAVAGSGSMEADLRRAAHRRVRFLGHLRQPELGDLLGQATVVVVPSLYEPFGLAALEAMAAGAPVIASDVGGLREVVGAGGGVLVPPEDPGALRAALRRLLAAPAERDRLAAAGRVLAGRHGWPEVAEPHVALYHRVLAARTARSTRTDSGRPEP